MKANEFHLPKVYFQISFVKRNFEMICLEVNLLMNTHIDKKSSNYKKFEPKIINLSICWRISNAIISQQKLKAKWFWVATSKKYTSLGVSLGTQKSDRLILIIKSLQNFVWEKPQVWLKSQVGRKSWKMYAALTFF